MLLVFTYFKFGVITLRDSNNTQYLIRFITDIIYT